MCAPLGSGYSPVKDTHIFGINDRASLDEHLEHVIVFPPARQMEHRVSQWISHILDLGLSLVGEKLPANVDVAGVNGGEKWNVAILEKKVRLA